MVVRRDDIAAGRASIHISMANVTTSALGVILFVFLPRMLTQTELGVLGAVTLSYTALQYVAQLGLSRSAQSLVSAATVEGADAAGRVISGIMWLTSGSAILLAIIAYLLAPTFSLLAIGNYDWAFAFRAGAVVVLANAVASNFEGLLQGIRDFALLAESRVVGQIFRIAVALILLFNGYGVIAVIAGLTLGQYGFVTIAIQFPVFLRRFRLVLPRLRELLAIVRYSLPLYGVTLLGVVTTYLDLFLLIAKGTTQQVGAYYVVINIAQAVSLMITQPFTGVVIPFMSKIEKEKGALEWAFKKATRYISFVIVPCVIGLASLSQALILILAGPKYLQVVLPVAVALFAYIPAAFAGLINSLLQARGKNTSILLNTIAGVTVEGVFGFFMIPLLGVIGAATCRLVLYLGWLGIGALQLKAIMTIRIDRRAFAQAMVASCAFLIIPLADAFWRHPIITLLSFVVATEVFLLTLKALRALNSEDIEVLTGAVPVRLSFLVRNSFISSLTDWLAS